MRTDIATALDVYGQADDDEGNLPEDQTQPRSPHAAKFGCRLPRKKPSGDFSKMVVNESNYSGKLYYPLAYPGVRDRARQSIAWQHEFENVAA